MRRNLSRHFEQLNGLLIDIHDMFKFQLEIGSDDDHNRVNLIALLPFLFMQYQ